MNSARNLQDIPTGEQASLYVLELLPPAERRDFERKLAADPALRTLVRELQGNVDALVLAEPAPPAPVAVWGRIAAELKASKAPLLAFPEGVRAWGLRTLAAAACLALGALLHLWLATAAKPGPDAAVAQGPTPAADAPVMFVTNHIVIQEVVPVPVSGEPANGPAPASAAAQAEVARLRQRVNMLASQVSALNQVLTQRLVLPNGVTRLHVFQLVGTNGLELPPPSLQSLPETLAHLATGQVSTPANAGVVPTETAMTNRLAAAHDPAVVTTTPTATSTTGTTPTVSAAVPTATGTGASTNTFASAPTLLNNGQPLGFINPDTGHGAVVMSSSTPLENVNYVVWQQFSEATGTTFFYNVGNGVANLGTTVIPILAWTNAPGSFFITVEPTPGAGSLTAPTGPVVALPHPGKN
jgi:anti-sigma-K factor RskA